MKNFLYKFLIILFVITFLPIVFYTFLENNNANRNEEVIKKIYKKQLETILSSINQFSNDVVRNWANKSNENFNLSDKEFQSFIERFMKQNPEISLLTRSEDYEKFEYSGIATDEIKKIVEDSLKRKKNQLRKMKIYLEGGYTKIESFRIKKHTAIYMLLKNEKKTILFGFLLSPNQFISNKLETQVKYVAREDFYIEIRDKVNNLKVFSVSDTLKETQTEVREPLWLFPNYEMGIKLNKKSIDDLALERKKTNLWLILGIDLILIVSAIVLYYTVRREMKLNQIRAEFISNVSHEIKTPIALINMYAETLEMGRIRDESKKNEYYKIIFRETQRLTEMVTRILNFSNIEKGKKKYNFANVNVNQLLDEILQNYKLHLEENGFSYKIEKTENLPNVYIDKEAIGESILNIVDNAIKYSKENKEVTFRTGFKNRFVYIDIEDKGIGIPEKYQKNIFDKFYRVTKGNLANEVKGTGLGLNIVKQIIDIHKGRVELKSKVGEGSCFKLLLPIVK